MTGYDPGEQHVFDLVERFGWMVQKVSPKEDEPQEWFAYTIGLSVTFGWPEIICFGLAQEVMHSLLNNAAEECKAHSLTPHEGMMLTEVANGFALRLAPFAREQWPNYMGWAGWFAKESGMASGSFNCLQLTWPDKQGRFPDDPECDPGIVNLQTPLERAS